MRQIRSVPSTRDPRYRPYRVAMWIAYFLAIILAIGTVVASVARHLSGPHRPHAAGTLPTRATVRICVQELEALHKEQNERAWRLGQEMNGREAITAFYSWSRAWEQRVENLADRCRLDASDPDPQGFGGRPELSRARDAVMALHRAYRAQVNRFAAEGADLAREAAAAIGAARAASAPRP